MAEYIFPTSAELMAIAQVKTPRLMADRPIFDIMPTRSVDDFQLAWEQMDNYVGLQQVRGLAGEPPRVKKVGISRYLETPGVYGEFIDLDENELTRRRTIGTYSSPVDLSDLVASAQDQLLVRRLDRIELIGWTLLATGTFSVAGPAGGIIHTGAYTTQTFTASVVWATAATSTPLADFRAVQLLGPAKGANFGSGARAYMNRTTFNQMLTNTNAADLGGRRTTGLSPINDNARLNEYLAGENLPGIVIYDDGYITDAGTFTRFVPNNKVIVVGQRPAGQTIGEYRYVRNVNNPNSAPGPYMKVVDKGAAENEPPPRRIDVHDGHNGGPVIFFPGSVVVMTV
jgi:hypothetical protein